SLSVIVSVAVILCSLARSLRPSALRGTAIRRLWPAGIENVTWPITVVPRPERWLELAGVQSQRAGRGGMAGGMNGPETASRQSRYCGADRAGGLPPTRRAGTTWLDSPLGARIGHLPAARG